MNIISESGGNPDSVAEANFQLSHNMQTRAQYRDAMRQRDESDRISDIEAPYSADVAGKTAKARLDAFVKWRDKTAGELDTLKAQKVWLTTAIEAPESVQAKRRHSIANWAQRLLAGDDITDADLADTGSIDASLSAAHARADAAKIAVAELGKQIESKTLGLKRLRERQRGFVQDAMLEHVAAEYGNRY